MSPTNSTNVKNIKLLLIESIKDIRDFTLFYLIQIYLLSSVLYQLLVTQFFKSLMQHSVLLDGYPNPMFFNRYLNFVLLRKYHNIMLQLPYQHTLLLFQIPSRLLSNALRDDELGQKKKKRLFSCVFFNFKNFIIMSKP